MDANTRERYQWASSDSNTPGAFYATVRGGSIDVLVRAGTQEEADRQAEGLARLLNSQMLPDGLDTGELRMTLDQP